MQVIELSIPQSVSQWAAAKMRGEHGAPTPVLWLEGIEVGADEGLRLEVVRVGHREEQPILGSAATVGMPQDTPREPVESMTLVIPLTEAAAELLVDREEVVLVLRVASSKIRLLSYERVSWGPPPEARR